MPIRAGPYHSSRPSHLLSLITNDTIGPNRETQGGLRHTVKPHPLFAMWGVGLSLGDSLYRAPTTFGNPATSLLCRGPWALRPRLAAGLPFSRRRSAIAHVNYRTNLEEGDIYAEWPFIRSQVGQLYAR